MMSLTMNSNCLSLPSKAQSIDDAVWQSVSTYFGASFKRPSVNYAILPEGVFGLSSPVLTIIQLSARLVYFNATDYYRKISKINGKVVTPEEVLKATLIHEYAHQFFSHSNEPQVIELANSKGLPDVDCMEKFSDSVSEAFAIVLQEALTKFRVPNQDHPKFYSSVVRQFYETFTALAESKGIHSVIDQLDEHVRSNFILPREIVLADKE